MHALAGVAATLGDVGLGRTCTRSREDMTGGGPRPASWPTPPRPARAVYLEHGCRWPASSCTGCSMPAADAPLLGAGWMEDEPAGVTAAGDLGVRSNGSRAGPDHLRCHGHGCGPRRGARTGEGRTKKEPSRRRPSSPGAPSLRSRVGSTAARRGPRRPEPPCPSSPRSRSSGAASPTMSWAGDRRGRGRTSRAVRRHPAGGNDFVARVTAHLLRVRRRGNPVLDLDGAVDGRRPRGRRRSRPLGMSGQMLVPNPRPDEKHLRVRFRFTAASGAAFVDQRTFGGLSAHPLVAAAGGGLPRTRRAQSPRPTGPACDLDAAVAGMRRSRTGLKRALLDRPSCPDRQHLRRRGALAGRLPGGAPPRPSPVGRAATCSRRRPSDAEALAAVARRSTAVRERQRGVGLLRRSLNVYGRADRACRRCGTPVRREAFMNRSSFSCPRCQPRPRHPHP